MDAEFGAGGEDSLFISAAVWGSGLRIWRRWNGRANTKGRTSVSFCLFRVVPECAWDRDFRVGGDGVGYFSAETGAFDLWHDGNRKAWFGGN